MFSKINSFSDSFHNIFIKGDWNHKNITKYFGDRPTVLARVLERRSCSVDIVKHLLKQGADINCQNDINSFSKGFSPLMIALGISNNEEVIRVLLEGGAEVNQMWSFGYTPLLIYLQREDCSVSVVEALLDFKANVNRKTQYSESPLATAIRNAKDDAVVQVLVERGAEVNDWEDLYNTPLILLLRQRINCDVDIVKLLLAKGADINCVDKYGYSPLVYAIQHHRDEAVIQTLVENGANVNLVCGYGKTPLLLYLSDGSSVDIVKLLLHYKAEINYKNIFGDSPLITALKNNRCKKIIQVLLEGGASVNTLDDSSMSPLCNAFRHSSHDVVKLLLDAGSSPNACKCHISALHCATDFSRSEFREDNLKLLLEKDVDVNSITKYGQSLLCFALQHGAKAHDIQLLLDAGASLNTCVFHSSPLVCATNCPLGASLREVGTPLREDVIQLLFGNGASMNDQGLKVLQDALRYCKYETEAIQLLLDLPGMDAFNIANKRDESLLHLAVKNPNCRPDAVKLLLNRQANEVNQSIESLYCAVSNDTSDRRVINLLLQNGSSVNKVNRLGQTPLHCAVSNKSCDPRVINILLQNGSPVNAKDKYDETALTLGVKWHRPANVLKDLLIAGAHIGKTKFSHGCLSRSNNGYELLEFLARQWDSYRDPKTIDSYKMLVKFFLLQNPELNIRNYPAFGMYNDKLLTFLNECMRELEIIDSLQVGHDHTFRMFVSRDCLSVEKRYDLNQILVCLIKNAFPVFLDVISARIDRSIIEKKLQVYTSKICSELLYVERVLRISEVAFNIFKYLPEDDLLRFILAFYVPVNRDDSGESSKNNPLLGRRNFDPSSRPPKYQKLCS